METRGSIDIDEISTLDRLERAPNRCRKLVSGAARFPFIKLALEIGGADLSGAEQKPPTPLCAHGTVRLAFLLQSRP